MVYFFPCARTDDGIEVNMSYEVNIDSASITGRSVLILHYFFLTSATPVKTESTTTSAANGLSSNTTANIYHAPLAKVRIVHFRFVSMLS
jgi:hypothetical protein